MPDLAIDPLIVALFFMIALPILAFIQFFSKPEKFSDRLNKQKIRSETVEPQKASIGTDPNVDVRKELPTSTFGGVGRFFDGMISRNEKLTHKILQSGLKYNASDLFILLLIGGVFVAVLISFILNISMIFAMVIVVILLFIIPSVYLNMAVSKRQRQFLSDFPDALDLVIRGIRSGLPVTEAIETIGTEFRGPMGETFGSIQSKVAIGQTLDEALWATSIQMPLPEFRFFIIALSIQQETGGNLGEILQKLSGMIRKRQQLKLKIKAMSSEARASAMIIGSLPFVMMLILYFVNPDYIMTLFTDPRGHILLGVGATMLTMGIGLMTKMSKFEI